MVDQADPREPAVTARAVLHGRLLKAFAPYVGASNYNENIVHELQQLAQRTVDEVRQELPELCLAPVAVNLAWDPHTCTLSFSIY